MTTIKNIEGVSQTASRLSDLIRSLHTYALGAQPSYASVRQPDGRFRDMIFYGVLSPKEWDEFGAVCDFSPGSRKFFPPEFHAIRRERIQAQANDERLMEEKRRSAEYSRVKALSTVDEIERITGRKRVSLDTLYLFDAAAAGKVSPVCWLGEFYSSMHRLLFTLAAERARQVVSQLPDSPLRNTPPGERYVSEPPRGLGTEIPIAIQITIESNKQQFDKYDFNSRLTTERGLAIGEVMRANIASRSLGTTSPHTHATTVPADEPIAKAPVDAGNSAKPARPKATVNALMIDAVAKDPTRNGWSSGQWATYLDCSKSTVVYTECWKAMQTLRDGMKLSKRISKSKACDANLTTRQRDRS